MSKKTKYTHKDLENIRRRYSDNFELLYDSVGTVKYRGYAKIEHELDHLEKIILKSLGLYISDPCPIGFHIHCESCTGYFRRVKKKRLINKMAKRGFKGLGVVKCDYKKGFKLNMGILYPEGKGMKKWLNLG